MKFSPRLLRRGAAQITRSRHNHRAYLIQHRKRILATAEWCLRTGDMQGFRLAMIACQDIDTELAAIHPLFTEGCDSTPVDAIKPSLTESAVEVVLVGPFRLLHLAWLGMVTVFHAKEQFIVAIKEGLQSRKAARKLKREGETATP